MNKKIFRKTSNCKNKNKNNVCREDPNPLMDSCDDHQCPEPKPPEPQEWHDKTLSTLHGDSMFLTIFLNFNILLKDPNLSTYLKVQLQITGAEQVPSTYIATLYHQLIYRLQNYALDLPISGNEISIIVQQIPIRQSYKAIQVS